MANMLQNSCKIIGFKKNMFYKIPPRGGGAGGGGGGGRAEVNHSRQAAYWFSGCCRALAIVERFNI